MSHYITADVRAAVGPTAGGCRNNALFISKYPDISCDGKDKEAKKGLSIDFAGLSHILKRPLSEIFCHFF